MKPLGRAVLGYAATSVALSVVPDEALEAYGEIDAKAKGSIQIARGAIGAARFVSFCDTVRGLKRELTKR